MDEPKTTKTDMASLAGEMAGAVRGRILRLHPQAQTGGLVDRFARHGEGWDRAGQLSGEIVGRFRSPAEGTASAMPLVEPVPSLPKANVLARRAAESVPAVGSSSPSVISVLPAPVQRVTTGGITEGGPKAGPTPVSDSVPVEPIRAAAGARAEAREISRRPAEAGSKAASSEIFVQLKKDQKIISSDAVDDVSPEQKSIPLATPTMRMTERSQNSLGPSLVQRHTGFGGVGSGLERSAQVAGDTGKSGGHLPLRTGERAQTQQSGSPDVSASLPKQQLPDKSAGAPVMRRADGAGNTLGIQAPAASGVTLGGVESVGSRTAASVTDSVAKPAPGGANAEIQMQRSVDTLSRNLPVVKPVSPVGKGAIQRRETGVSLGESLFTRNSGAFASRFGSSLPAARSLVEKPMGVGSAPGVASGSSTGFTDFGSSAMASVASSGIVSPVVQRTVDGWERKSINRSVLPTLSGSVEPKGRSISGPTGGGTAAGFPQVGPMMFRSPITVGENSPMSGVSAGASNSRSSAAKPNPSGGGQGALPLVLLQGGNQTKPARSISLARSSVSTSTVTSESGSTASLSETTSSASTPGSSTTSTNAGPPSTTPSEIGGGATSTTSTTAGVDLERLADEVYRIIERRLIMEKESRGL